MKKVKSGGEIQLSVSLVNWSVSLKPPIMDVCAKSPKDLIRASVIGPIIQCDISNEI